MSKKYIADYADFPNLFLTLWKRTQGTKEEK